MPKELARPRIGYFHIGAKDGDTWCLPIADGERELPEMFQVELYVSDVNVMAARKVVTVTIIDDEGKTY